MRLKTAVIVALILSASQTQGAFAFVAGGSNFVIGTYPAPNCPEPDPYFVGRPTRIDLAYARIARQDYVDCIVRYVKAARADQERIEEEVEKAAAKVKATAPR